jgi:PAS domain-containing protein
MQLPAQVAVYHGPDHYYQFVNPNYQRMFPHRAFLGRPFREGMPEAEGLGVVSLFDQVYQTGEPYYGHEIEGWFDFRGNGKPEQLFFELSLHPLRNAQGKIDGVLDFSYDVTEQVLARRQLQQLNQELESRVRERTCQFEAAQQATERQRQQWHELFMRAPAGICIFNGPEWVYEFVNPRYQAMFPGRELLGKRLVDALPEVADQPLMTILHRVYDTGEPFEASEVLVPLARTAVGPVEDIYFDLTYQARRNEAGQIDGFITYAQDVTARVLARREREAQQGELQRVFEQAPVAIGLFMGEDLRITALNPPMALLIGMPASQPTARAPLAGRAA